MNPEEPEHINPDESSLDDFSSVKKEMDEMRRYVRAGRKEEDEDYDEIKDDPSYKALSEFADFNLDLTPEEKGFDTEKFYPSIIEQKTWARPPEDPDAEEELESIDWKGVQNKVYIKEFQENPDKIKAEIRRMKSIHPDDAILPYIENMRGALPRAKQDVEKFLGEHIISTLAYLFIGIGLLFLFNYGISEGFIPEWLRVVIGSVLGVGCLVGGHFLVSKQTHVTLVLLLVAQSLMHYTVHVANESYHMITLPVTFGIHIALTLTITALAFYYNRFLLALFSYLGGVLMPTMTTGFDFVSWWYFLYLYTITIPYIVMAFLENWRVLQYVAYGVCSFFLVSWWIHIFSHESTYRVVLLFSGGHYLLFQAIFTLWGSKVSTSYRAIDRKMLDVHHILCWILLASNLYFSNYERLVPLVCIGVFLLASFHIARHYLTRFYHKHVVVHWVWVWAFSLWYAINRGLDWEESGFMYVLLTAVALFIGLEFRSRSFLRISSYVSIYLLFVFLVVFIKFYAIEGIHAFMVNRVYLLSVCFLLFSGFAVVYHRLIAQTRGFVEVGAFAADLFQEIIGSFGLIVFYLATCFEILTFKNGNLFDFVYQIQLVNLFTFALLLGLDIANERFGFNRLKMPVYYLYFFFLLIYYIVPRQGIYGHLFLRDAWELNRAPFSYFGTILLITFTQGFLFYRIIIRVIAQYGFKTPLFQSTVWLGIIAGVYTGTVLVEDLGVLLNNLFQWYRYNEWIAAFRHLFLSSLWALGAIGLMYWGVKSKLKLLRWVALGLLGITAFKFFVYDFWVLSILSKIISIIIVGVVFWVISQYYQKQLKVLINDGQLVLDRDVSLASDDLEQIIDHSERLENMSDDDEEEDDDDRFELDDFGDAMIPTGYDEDEDNEEDGIEGEDNIDNENLSIDGEEEELLMEEEEEAFSEEEHVADVEAENLLSAFEEEVEDDELEREDKYINDSLGETEEIDVEAENLLSAFEEEMGDEFEEEEEEFEGEDSSEVEVSDDHVIIPFDRKKEELDELGMAARLKKEGHTDGSHQSNIENGLKKNEEDENN